jgi:predicted GNAT family N-acyltransferase
MSTSQEQFDNIAIKTIEPLIDKELYQQEKSLRLEVLLLPTGRTEWWHRDSISKHIVALNDQHFVVGCVLLVLGGEERQKNTAILCQMAVSEPYRSHGIGKRLVAKCESIALEQGIARIYLHARLTATKFYENCGYKRQGEIFEEVGLPHIAMVKTL